MDTAAALHSTALVIVRDDDSRQLFVAALRRALFATVELSSGRDALELANRRGFDVVLLDLEAADINSVELLSALRRQQTTSLLILMRRTVTSQVVIEWIRFGALKVLKAPVHADDLVKVMESALGQLGDPPLAATQNSRTTPQMSRVLSDPRSAIERWAVYVVRACEAHADIKTLQDWALAVAVSYTTLTENCRLVGVRPIDARDLARALRAMTQAARIHCRPELFLDISDSRTLRHFRGAAGPGFATVADSVSTTRFLEFQRFIDPGNEGLHLLKQLTTYVWPTLQNDRRSQQ